MALDIETIEKKFDEWDVDSFLEKHNLKNEIKEKRLKQIHQYFKKNNNFEEILNKIILKYDSKEYTDRYYKKNIYPPEKLLSVLFNYAEAYGRGCTPDEYDLYSNDFTTEIVFINNYYFLLNVGQGSFVSVVRNKYAFQEDLINLKYFLDYLPYYQKYNDNYVSLLNDKKILIENILKEISFLDNKQKSIIRGKLSPISNLLEMLSDIDNVENYKDIVDEETSTAKMTINFLINKEYLNND